MTKKQAEAHLAKLARRRARYAERKKQKQVAPTPRAPEQLPLFVIPSGHATRITREQQNEIRQDARNLGRAWIAQILAGMEDA